MKFRARKAIVGIAAIASLSFMSACGTTADSGKPSPSAENSAGGGSSKPEGPYRIATVPKVEGISWFEAMKEGVNEFNDAQGDAVDAWQIGPDTEDAAKQVQIIEDLIAQEVDAIVVVPNDPQALTPALKKARDRGIVVITHEAPALAGTDAIDYDLEAFDNAYFGEVMFEQLASCMEGEGTFVGMVGSLTSETHMAWYNAGVEWLEKNAPGITAVAPQPYEDSNDDAKARANALEILKAYPDLGGFVNGSVSANANMAAVLKEKDNKNVCMSGLSLPSVAGPYLEEGWIYSAQAWSPGAAGYAANELALKVLNGETIESGIDLNQEGYENVTIENGLVIGEAVLMLSKGQFPDGYPF